MVKIYKQPFAHDGDAIAIPDASQPDGKMSSADGWTPDYQLPKTDPNYKPVGRQEMNGVFKEVTEALGEVQVQGAASWSPDGAPYPINAQVYHNGKQWLALRANSVAPVEGEDWAAIGTAATYDVGEATGQAMLVGAFGVGRGKITDWVDAEDDVYAGISTSLSAKSGLTGLPSGFAQDRTSKFTFGNVSHPSVLLAQKDNRLAFFSGSESSPVNYVIVHHSGNILQTTGSSTNFPMSQKATTDAINNNSNSIGVGQTWQDLASSRTGDTWYTNTTGRSIQVACYTDENGMRFQVRKDPNASIVSLSNLYGASNERSQLPFIIPPGWQYRLDKVKSSKHFHWVELR